MNANPEDGPRALITLDAARLPGGHPEVPVAPVPQPAAPAEPTWLHRNGEKCTVAAFMAILFFVAFGFERPFSVALAVARFLIDHYRVVAGVIFFYYGIGLMELAGWLDWKSEAAPSPPAKASYHRKTGQIYGDARPADDWEIDEALRDKTGGFRQIFED